MAISYLFIKARKTLALYSLCVCQVLVIAWLFFGMIENMANTTEELLFYIRFPLFSVCFFGPCWFIFSLIYSGKIFPKNKWIIFLILLPNVVTFLPVLSFDHFYLIVLKKEILDPSFTEWGIFFKINLVFSYSYTFLGSLIVLRSILKEFYALKKKFAIVFIAISFPTVIYVLGQIKAVYSYRFDILPVNLSIFSVLLTIAVFQYRFLNVVPYVTYGLFSEMMEVLIIVDNNDRIIEFNKAAIKEFSGIVNLKKCELIDDFFEGLINHAMDVDQIQRISKCFRDIKEDMFSDSIDLYSISKGNKNHMSYSLYIKPLYDKKGVVLARVLSLKDNTYFVEDYIEKERERISHEIHEGLSNMSHVITMNLEYVLKHLDQRNIVKERLEIAYQTARGVNIHLRRILEELSPVDIEDLGLIHALESLFKKVIGVGIHLEFTHKNLDMDFISKKRHGYIIYKTCLEAINNSFFNGKAKKMDIVLTLRDGILKLFITDDGIGCETLVKGRGLKGIESLVRSVGGWVSFGSPCEGGFVIKAEMPLHYNKILTIREEVI